MTYSLINPRFYCSPEKHSLPSLFVIVVTDFYFMDSDVKLAASVSINDVRSTFLLFATLFASRVIIIDTFWL